jgi:tetratricopeptide (TPR) repeat protein
METYSFLIWIIVIGGVTIFALSNMIQAYSGSGSLAVAFTEPIGSAAASGVAPHPLPTLNADAAAQFQQGCEAFGQGKYREASDRFAQATKLDETFAEAFHNLGLVTANLRQDNNAAQHLLRAGECYLEQGNTAGYEQVKEALGVLKARKLAKESAV